MEIDKEFQENRRRMWKGPSNIRRYNSNPKGIEKRSWSKILSLHIVPAQLLSVYMSLPHQTDPSTTNAPLLRRPKAHVRSACVNCKKAHLACDGTDPHLFSLFCLSMATLFTPFFPFLPLSCDEAFLRSMHVKRRLRAGPLFSGHFLFHFLRFFFCSSFVWAVLNLNQWFFWGGDEPVSGVYFHDCIAPNFKVLVMHQKIFLFRADPSNKERFGCKSLAFPQPITGSA